jgi:hypothetical protein
MRSIRPVAADSDTSSDIRQPAHRQLAMPFEQ